MRRLIALLVVTASLVGAAEARAEVIVERDDEGRRIVFDVRADGVDVSWYAELLRDAVHGDEISSVRIRIVPWSEVSASCGAEAAGCYGRGRMTVPAGQGDEVAQTLLHEYGHHVDQAGDHPLWWRARGMEELVDSASVADDYSLGWDRSVSEIFAEDYAQLHVDGPYKIRWLLPPSARVRQALLADLGAGAPPSGSDRPARPAYRPVVLSRSGVLGPGQQEELSFGLLGPGRRVTFTAEAGGSVRLELVCDGRRIAVRTVRAGGATINRGNLGPAECEAVLRSADAEPTSYAVRVRLVVQR